MGKWEEWEFHFFYSLIESLFKQISYACVSDKAYWIFFSFVCDVIVMEYEVHIHFEKFLYFLFFLAPIKKNLVWLYYVFMYAIYIFSFLCSTEIYDGNYTEEMGPDAQVDFPDTQAPLEIGTFFSFFKEKVFFFRFFFLECRAKVGITAVYHC